jgi:hypothetical protein
MYPKVMNINDGAEIEELLSSSCWPNSTSMTFILLLHHLVKLWKICVGTLIENQKVISDKRGSLVYMKKVANEFGNVIL